MKRFQGIRLSLLLTALCLAGTARADIITLKSGEKVEGRILSETPDSIEVEYHLTPKIKDTKTILKSDIKELKRQTAAEVEFEERALKKVLPTTDLLTASDYESVIQDKLRTFVAKYPDTPESKEVEKMINTLAEEKSMVLSGQLKVEGKWLDAATVKRETYNIEAYRQRMLMKARAEENNDLRYINALRSFETLRNNYVASAYFVQSIPDALDLLKKYETQLQSMILDVPGLVKKRDDGLRSMTQAEADTTRRALDAEAASYKATFDQQTKDKVKWKDIYKYDIKGLQDALITVRKERSDIQSLDLAALQEESEMLMSIIRYLADRNVSEARTVYEKLNKQNNLATPAARPLLASLGKEIDTMQKEVTIETKKEKAATIAAPAPSTTPAGKDDAAASSNPVAEALKKAQEKKNGTDAKGKPVTATDGKTPGAKPATADDKTAPRPAPTPAAPQPPEDTAMTLTDYIPYAGGGLILVLLVAWFIGKKKKDKE